MFFVGESVVVSGVTLPNNLTELVNCLSALATSFKSLGTLFTLSPINVIKAIESLAVGGEAKL